MIKGILFDFDGTLANTIDLIVATFEHTCVTALGVKPDRQRIIDTIGLPLGDALELLSGIHEQQRILELRQIYGAFNAANHDTMIKPIPGVAELLVQLKQRDLKLAVVTSKKAYMLERGMQCLGMLPYIDATVSVLDTERGKPAPDPMLLACERLGLTPGECLCVGDSPFDMQSGNAAGCVTVAVEYTQLDWQSLLDQGKPDYTISQPLDLLQLLDKLAATALPNDRN